MLSGSKRYGAGALVGSVPDRSPHSRMKLADSLVRSGTQGTSPVPAQRAGIQVVLAAADAVAISCGTASGTTASTVTAPARISRRRQPFRVVERRTRQPAFPAAGA